ncbi:DPH2-like protein [Mya arenaria]|uniref:2-(3-amino-3-carboxypropyl)histidine synthase subunit 2 n=1 Tax=Mya arenaria TaxID=6604 RepID=A0ABY7FVC9_MYAAR|nr:2-(3-amino-3-carboxypropyl)histidine synthase subunit 2-like [Mya arenaria]XP_052776273.1 2-(3-amino-3-carboxypropyl)histidine synthase subunit 2-like [Mya arenaria]WAR24696.1 DPH2-like protein [Mya arenaria]
MEGTSAFYTDSDTVLRKTLNKPSSQTPQDQISVVYELERTLHWVQENGFKRVALQFSDELMGDAVAVSTSLEKSVTAGCSVFILGDTSYGSCCVDEVAAQHFNADCLVHYGRSCLSQPSTMPVMFVYGRLPLDVNNCVNEFRLLYPETGARVIVMYETVYQYACDEIMNCLSQTYTNLVLSNLGPSDSEVNANVKTVYKCGRSVFLPDDATLDDYSVFFIGVESLTFTNILYNFPGCQFYSYNPMTKTGRKESVNVNKMLMKRYYLVEKAKDAKIVGILVGTLGVSNYLEILDRLKVLIKKAGKKSYVFIVGKINVAKLANFMEIDMFVLIACAENSLLDSSEFYRPVVTPYEMELACNTERKWTGEYPTDFHQLLEGGNHFKPIPDTLVTDDTDISLVTGRLRFTGLGDVEAGTAVMVRDDSLTVATQAESAGEYLGMRSWQGLEQKLGETPVTKAVEGQRGIAMGYSTEPSILE